MDPSLPDFVNSLTARSPRSNAAFTRIEARCLARLLNRTLNTCSARLVQQSSNAIISVALSCPEKRRALCKYVTSLSEACKPRPSDQNQNFARQTTSTFELAGLSRNNNHDDKYHIPSSAHKRLHALYMMSNVLLALVRHMEGPMKVFLDDLEQFRNNGELNDALMDLRHTSIRLFEQAACRGDTPADNVSKQLVNVLAQWRYYHNLFSPSMLDSLQAMADAANERELATVIQQLDEGDIKKIVDARKADAEAMKWTLPRQHGVKDDPNAPWWELPAANGLFMRRSRGYPLRAAAFENGGYPLDNAGQEASPELKKEVTSLRDELLSCFAPGLQADQVQDIDPLGNLIYKDPERATRNYWGFSYDGIAKIKGVEEKARLEAVGYDDVKPLAGDKDPFRKIGGDVQRAAALARGGRGGGGRGGGGGWRGGAPGYRGRGGPRGY